MERIEATTTFKHIKIDLAHEGYDPAATNDAIFVDDPARATFVRVDRALYARIAAGSVRL
jgi:fatty-acyl-CoA synthase